MGSLESTARPSWASELPRGMVVAAAGDTKSTHSYSLFGTPAVNSVKDH